VPCLIQAEVSSNGKDQAQWKEFTDDQTIPWCFAREDPWESTFRGPGWHADAKRSSYTPPDTRAAPTIYSPARRSLISRPT
jgi:hypothetical protein